VDNVLGVLCIARQPACEVVGGVKMWQDILIKSFETVVFGQGPLLET
jgi:hypothetical protein